MSHFLIHLCSCMSSIKVTQLVKMMPKQHCAIGAKAPLDFGYLHCAAPTCVPPLAQAECRVSQRSSSNHVTFVARGCSVIVLSSMLAAKLANAFTL